MSDRITLVTLKCAPLCAIVPQFLKCQSVARSASKSLTEKIYAKTATKINSQNPLDCNLYYYYNNGLT